MKLGNTDDQPKDYQVFTNKEDRYDMTGPSVGAAKAYSEVFVKSAMRTMTERVELAAKWKWDASKCKNEIGFEEHNRQRTIVLFPELKKELNDDTLFINVAEVDRAEENFSKLTGLAFREPSVTLSDLGDYLTQLTRNLEQKDDDLVLTTSTLSPSETQS